GVSVKTEGGKTYHAKKLVLCTGAWMPDILANEASPESRQLAAQQSVTRQVVYWFEIKGDPSRFYEENFPSVIWDVAVPKHMRVTGQEPISQLYMLPVTKGSPWLKLAHEETGPPVNPDYITRFISPDEQKRVYEVYVEPNLPGVGPRCMDYKVCMYTKIPGGRGVIDYLPGHRDRVLGIAACSGHFFKYSEAIGEAVAEICSKGRASHIDIAPFSIRNTLAWLRQRNLLTCDA